MTVRDLAHDLTCEHETRVREAEHYQTSVRMPGYIFDRLDAIGRAVGESRNRLMVRLLDSASFELAIELARQDDGMLNKDVLSEYLAEDEIDRVSSLG